MNCLSMLDSLQLEDSLNLYQLHVQDSILVQQVIHLEDILKQLFQDEQLQYLSLLAGRIQCLQYQHVDFQANEHTMCSMLLSQ